MRPRMDAIEVSDLALIKVSSNTSVKGQRSGLIIMTLARIFYESSWLQMQGVGREAIVILWRALRNAADAAKSARSLFPRG